MPTQNAPGIPLWIKLSAGGGVVLVLLVLAMAIAVFLIGRRSVDRRHAELENAIRGSANFNVPVTVDVGRFAFYDMSRLNQEATPAAYTLKELGLLYIHTGMYSDVSPTYNSSGNTVIDPKTGLVPNQYRHTDLELIGEGKTMSANWEPYEDQKNAKVGWKVPIGDREFLRVVEVEKVPAELSPDTAMMVTFIWKWKPNKLGESFDKGSTSYVAPFTPRGYARSSFDPEINDSRATYWGTVELHRTGETWEASRLSWHGPGGVRLSQSGSADVDKILREAEKAR